MSRFVLIAAFALALFPVASFAQAGDSLAKQRAEWNRPAEPFRIAGNLYYVGTKGLASYLITDPKGHILIDGALEESAPLIAANIRRLGFRLEDIRYLLVNHAHWDHSGGLAELKRLSGAKLLASAADRPALESGIAAYRNDISPSVPVKVDRTIAEGERIRVGRTSLITHLTPGHTKGCTSWTMHIPDEGRPLDILFACSITVAGQKLVGDPLYPEAVGNFSATFAKLTRLHADIFLAFHPESFDLEGKSRRLAAGDADAFVDPGELGRQIKRAESAFAEELARQRAAAAPQ